MWHYILKRLLIAVPTLLGITVITFLLIRLAPGDPTDLEGAGLSQAYTKSLSREMVEETRKRYGLDKPILLNFDVKDRRRAVLSAWEAIADLLDEIEEAEQSVDPGRVQALRETVDARVDRLARFGRRLIPYLVPLALTERGEEFEVLVLLLREGAGVDEAHSREALAMWWRQKAASFKPEEIQRVVRRLETFSGDQASAGAAFIREELGELALPALIEGIETLEDSPARQRFIALAAPWAGYTKELDPDSETSRYLAAERFIRAWWEREGLTYREIGALERLLKTFSEAQYPIWLGQILRLDFGTSYVDRQPVTGKVWEAFKVTFTFQVVVILLIYLISVPLGVLSAVKQDSLTDRLITLGLFMLYSLPSFFVAYLLIFLLGKGQFADLFPIQGLNSAGAENLGFWAFLMDRIWHMILPVACMTYGGLAVLSRYTRAGMLEVIRQDYIRTARAKGLPEGAVILKHALRNGIIPILTLIGGLLPALISGSVIIEYIFDIPGMGWLGFTAVQSRDYPVVMAIAFFSAALVLIGVLLSDILYAAVDPRIRFEEKT